MYIKKSMSTTKTFYHKSLLLANPTNRNGIPIIKKPPIKVVFVPRTGIEPALPCENQILSLARLPIPPSGLRVCNITTKELYIKIVFYFLPTTRINFKFKQSGFQGTIEYLYFFTGL